MRNIAERYKVVQLANPKTTNGGFNSDAVSLKNANRVAIVVNVTQAVGHATAFTLEQGTVVAMSDNKALTGNARIWANEDVAATDTLVAKTAAKLYTVTNDIKLKQIVFEFAPEDVLDIAGGFDCVWVVAADSSQATNFASIIALLDERYQQATPPAAITD